MNLADQIIEHGPYAKGDVSPFVGEIEIEHRGDVAEINELRAELIELRRLSAAVTSYEEWRVTGTWSGQDYAFVWSPIGSATRARGFENPQAEAHAFIEGMREFAANWADGPHLHKRTVTVSEWEAQA